MSTPMVSVQLPASLYSRLQSRAAREHTDPVEMISRLIAAESLPSAGDIVAEAGLRGGRPVIAGTGITVRTVLINDEIASAPRGQEAQRRGTTADHIVVKIAGAAAENMLPLHDVIRITEKAIAGARSLGVALSSCTLPATGKEIFDLPDDMMEVGMGLHGEPGMERMKLLPADEVTGRIVPRIVQDLPYRRDDEIVLILNGYGATTRMELFIVNRKIRAMLSDLGIRVYGTEIGEFCTSQEMKGVSVTFIRLDDELKGLYDLPCDSPFYKKTGF